MTGIIIGQVLIVLISVFLGFLIGLAVGIRARPFELEEDE